MMIDSGIVVRCTRCKAWFRKSLDSELLCASCKSEDANAKAHESWWIEFLRSSYKGPRIQQQYQVPTGNEPYHPFERINHINHDP